MGCRYRTMWRGTDIAMWHGTDIAMWHGTDIAMWHGTDIAMWHGTGRPQGAGPTRFILNRNAT